MTQIPLEPRMRRRSSPLIADIQPLMGAVFNPPGPAIELEPLCAGNLSGSTLDTNETSSVLAALGLAQEQGALFGQRKADLFARQRRGADRPTLRPSLVDFLGAGLVGVGFRGGENRPRGPRSTSEGFRGRWADYPSRSADSRHRVPAPGRARSHPACARHPATPSVLLNPARSNRTRATGISLVLSFSTMALPGKTGWER